MRNPNIFLEPKGPKILQPDNPDMHQPEYTLSRLRDTQAYQGR